MYKYASGYCSTCKDEYLIIDFNSLKETETCPWCYEVLEVNEITENEYGCLKGDGIEEL